MNVTVRHYLYLANARKITVAEIVEQKIEHDMTP